MKKILVLGGTGAVGVYLVPKSLFLYGDSSGRMDAYPAKREQ